jgi:hypothetical protein
MRLNRLKENFMKRNVIEKWRLAFIFFSRSVDHKKKEDINIPDMNESIIE